jgi:hypothetical protein
MSHSEALDLIIEAASRTGPTARREARKKTRTTALKNAIQRLGTHTAPLLQLNFLGTK